MSLFSVQSRKHTAYYDHLMSMSRTPGKERLIERQNPDVTPFRSEPTPGESTCEASRLSDKSQQINRTYVISASKNGGGGQQQTPHRGRLTLQRRSRRKTGAETTEKTMTDSSQNTTTVPEKRLTLQRRARTPSLDKSVYGQHGVQQTHKVLSEPNGRLLMRSASLKARVVETQGKPAHSKTPSSFSSSASRQLEAQTCKTPTKKTPFEKIASKRDVFERLAMREAPKPVTLKCGNLERPKAQDATPVPAPRPSKTCTGAQRPQAALPVIKTSIQNEDTTQARTSTPAPAPTPMEQPLSRPSEALKQHESFKMENSAVTVAVRVRPFNARFAIYLILKSHGIRFCFLS